METRSEYVNKVYELLLERMDQVNVKSNKPAYGKAAEYERLLETCQFKLVVWWRLKKDGTPYSAYEVQQGKRNRRYIPSFDTVNNVTDHEYGHSLLIDFFMQNMSRINKAILIWNNYGEGEEWIIANLNPDNIKASRYVHPTFKEDQGTKYCTGTVTYPLRKDKMRSAA